MREQRGEKIISELDHEGGELCHLRARRAQDSGYSAAQPHADRAAAAFLHSLLGVGTPETVSDSPVPENRRAIFFRSRGSGARSR